MSASEFAFLALGLVLGVASGAALIVVLRSRPPAPREVRVTVAPDSIPRRRSATLAEDAFVTAFAEPARGGPADRREVDRAAQAAVSPDGTSVRTRPQPPAGAGDPESSRPVVSVRRPAPPMGPLLHPSTATGGVGPAAFAIGPVAPRFATAGGDRPAMVAVPIHHEADPQVEALRGRTAAAESHRSATVTAVLEPPATRTTPALADATDGRPVAAAMDPSHTTPETPDAVAATDEGCPEARRIADERCALASRAREQADVAADALRAAQRAYDDHHARADQAAATADPRAIRAAKEAAQLAFRQARAGATTKDAIETAARDWLSEINRINRLARESTAQVQHERDAANALQPIIERLTLDADAARISAESAREACIAARQAVADCQEAAAAETPAAGFPAAPSVGLGPGYGNRDRDADDESELEAAFAATGPGEPAILRLVRGDRATLIRLVDQLADGSEAERRRWQLALADLVDAILNRSIEAAALTFPVDHRFWGAFTRQQNRDIVAALSSLGFRFDGLGGWADDRVPTQRDLSLAVGYAGLDPMRIRQWPNDAEMRELLADVAVAADEYLTETAGGLTLGELVDVLGRRADTLTELWNDWGLVRPLLLAGG